MLVDQETDEMHIPLNHIKDDQTAFLEVNPKPWTKIMSKNLEREFHKHKSKKEDKNLMHQETIMYCIIVQVYVFSIDKKMLWY